MRGIIDVATCFDKKALYGALALIASLRQHARPARPVRLFAVTPHDSEDLRSVARASNTASFEVVVRPVVNTYADVPIRENITATTYLRYQLPEILPDLSKVVYLDSDTIINADLSPLFDTDVSGVPLAAVPDFAHPLGSREWEGYRVVYEGKTYVFRDYIEKGLGIGNLDSFPYMKAGILLINLDEWRKSGLGGRVVNFLAEHRLNFPDQDSLNRHIGGNFIRLDARWNAQAPCTKRRARFLPKLSRGKKADWAAIRDLWFRDPWIVHYTGANKPWIASDRATPFDALWWTFAAHSPLANKVEKDYLAERQAAGIQKLKIPARRRISLNTDTARA